ncbi:MAG: nitrile hydratase [Rhodospirillaceae bacterium TMED8]|nr:nitrile hydratase [Magnetovibrio sp.]OUT51938.1 MAG: nitrile hydratase [Rhodospirillaceae bacterium TMED8]|tara:strand:- start:256 stop:549 length:294 start_codon:yes stop_codon:yes gene_type:complete
MSRFVLGDTVQVRQAYPPGHLRTPTFIRGKRGVVEASPGIFANPEELAYGRPGTPKQPLYRVRFLQSEVWSDYTGPTSDTIMVDIYEHWLIPDGPPS